MKKLLGLLAITPMAVTACGSADPVVEKEVKEMELTYSEETNTLVVKDIDIKDADDYEAYHDLGKLIKEEWALNDVIGDATRIVLEGEFKGKWIHHEVTVDEIKDDSDTKTPFADFRSAMRHYYKETGEMSSYANFAKHLKEASEHIAPTEPDDVEKARIKGLLQTIVDRDFSTSPATYEEYRKNKEENFEEDGGYGKHTNLDVLSLLWEFEDDVIQNIRDLFNSEYWSLTFIDHLSENTFVIVYQHETDPVNIEFIINEFTNSKWHQ